MGSAPQPPSYAQDQAQGAATAQQQQQLNTQTMEQLLQANAGGQSNPFYSTQFTPTQTDPTTGLPSQYAATQTYSPAEQNLANTMIGNQTMLGGNAMSALFNTMGQYGSGNPNLIGTANSLTNQMMGNELNSMQPYFNIQNEQLQSQLAAQGLNPNDKAWQNAWMSQQNAQGQNISNFVAQQYPQAFNMAQTNYTLPLNIAMSEMQAATPQGITPPTVQPAQMQPANLIGAVANAGNINDQIYQSQMQQYSAMMSGLFGIPSALLGGIGRGMGSGMMF
jgi:hypothetical protein